MLMHPVNGLFAQITRGLGLGAIDWFASVPLLAIIIIVSWECLPFALLILLTAIQSLDRDQLEAARMDGANAIAESEEGLEDFMNLNKTAVTNAAKTRILYG